MRIVPSGADARSNQYSEQGDDNGCSDQSEDCGMRHPQHSWLSPQPDVLGRKAPGRVRRSIVHLANENSYLLFITHHVSPSLSAEW